MNGFYKFINYNKQLLELEKFFAFLFFLRTAKILELIKYEYLEKLLFSGSSIYTFMRIL